MASRRRILEALTTDAPLSTVLGALIAFGLDMRVHPHCAPYLEHTVAGFVDGSPASRVVAVISGADPAGSKWCRFTISRTGDGVYELGVFPTAFHNADAPLAPGIPPSTSRVQQ